MAPFSSPFSVAELKDRAVKAKDASVSRIQHTRDRYSSASSKDLDLDPNFRASASPRPSLSERNQSSSPTHHVPHAPSAPSRPPPVVRRDTRPVDQTAYTPPPPPIRPTHSFRPKSSVTAEQPPSSDINHIDWKNLSPADKEVFFSWLDEFFSRYLNIVIPPRKGQPGTALAKASRTPAPGVEATVRVVSRPLTPAKPPTPPPSSRPPQAFIPARGAQESFTMSYPPACVEGSSAQDVARYFATSTYWDSPWYESDDFPPALQDNRPPSWTASWQMSNNKKTKYVGSLFADLSACWYSVQFSTTARADPNDPRAVIRDAKYLPRPTPRDKAILVDAHETYGETIAGFAESFEGTGQYCARGECWDLANEALKYFDQYDYVPKPVPSIARTHGHLIYEGKAARKGAEQMGRWRGGDDRIRRGDIVEWRSVRIGMPGGGWAMLGQPDHTAVIVADSVPSTSVSDGVSVRPSELGSLVVVEQSLGKPPARATYTLNMLEEGEVWVYRPIGMLEYVGCMLAPRIPDGVDALSLQ